MFRYRLLFHVTVILLCAVILSVSLAIAKQEMAVEIKYRGDSQVGQKLYAKIKEKIEETEGLRLTIINENRFKIYLSSIKINDDYCAISLILTVSGPKNPNSVYVNDYLYLCGLKNIEELADGIIVILERHADAIRNYPGK